MVTYIIASYSIDKPFAWGGQNDGPFASKEAAVAALRKEDLSRYDKPNHHHMGRCIATMKKIKKNDDDKGTESIAVIDTKDRDLGLRSGPYELPTG